ncbi:MAG: hypothetical protein WDO71_27915 [Bacteroidota bacterium]
MQQNLILNIIPFKPPVKQVTFPFYKEYKEGYCSFYIEEDMKGLLDGKMTLLEQADLMWLYTDFQEPKEGALVLDIDPYPAYRFCCALLPAFNFQPL